jgi:hypothetical protein
MFHSLFSLKSVKLNTVVLASSGFKGGYLKSIYLYVSFSFKIGYPSHRASCRKDNHEHVGEDYREG